MKFGFLCSAGGSPVFSALSILFKLNYIDKSDIKILTDRDSIALNTAVKNGIECRKIEWTNKSDFSKKAFDYFNDCEATLLLYSRLVGEELYLNMPTLNIHPSLLPVFKGQGALNKAYEFKVRFLGASLHIVDNTVDGGNLISQIVMPIPFNSNLDYINKISYLEKTYLVSLYIEFIKEKIIKIDFKNSNFDFLKSHNYNKFANPCIISKDIQAEYNNLFRENLYKYRKDKNFNIIYDNLGE